MTKREYFEKIKAMVTENAELTAFVEKEIAKIKRLLRLWRPQVAQSLWLSWLLQLNILLVR